MSNIRRAEQIPANLFPLTCTTCGTPKNVIARVYKHHTQGTYVDQESQFVHYLPCGHCPGVGCQDLTEEEVTIVLLMLEEA
jgi:hypothetical protein